MMTRFRSRRGFTLLELLVCIAIVAILANLAFASFGSAKASAKHARTLSNLRQCYLSLALYEGSVGSWPSYDHVGSALTGAPTKDPEDYWKIGFGKGSEPMINSYAYIRGHRLIFGSDADWSELLVENATKGRVTPLLASTWQSQPRPRFFSSSKFHPTPPEFFRCFRAGECVLPQTASFVFLDGSAKRRNVYSGPPRPFYWDHLFYGGMNQ